MAWSAQGMVFRISSATGVTTATGQAIGEVVTFSITLPSRNMIEVSNLGSTIETYIPGIVKGSQVTLECNYVATDAAQAQMKDMCLSTVTQSLLIGFADSNKTKLTLDGYLSGMDVSGGVNDRMRVSYTFQVTAPPTWSTYT